MTLMDQSELALLQLYARTRDAFAFRELVERHQNMVFAACHRVLGNRADAEDAAQNCFLKVSQTAERLRAPVGGWLHTVAVRSAIDMLRRRTVRRAREHDAALHADRARTRDASWADVRGEVDAAIVALPERLRTPIVLYFLEGHTQADIAAELGAVGGRDALVQLLKLLADPDARVHYFASRSIVEHWPSNDSAGLPGQAACVAPEGTGLAVARSIENETWPKTRQNMFTIARALRDPKMLPVLKKQLATVLDDQDKYLRSLIWSSGVIADIGGAEAEAILLAAVDQLPKQHARHVMSALAKLGTDAAIARWRKHIDATMKKGNRGYLFLTTTALARSDNPAAAHMENPEAPVIWPALAALNDERAVKAMLAAVAKGNSSAAGALVLSTAPHCVNAARNVLAGDDAKLRGLLMTGYRNQSSIIPISAYYAVRLALAELPGANEELKSERINMLGWAHDPRGNDALGKLLVNNKESLKLHRLTLFTLLRRPDPGLAEPIRHVSEHAADKRLRQEAQTILKSWGVIPPKPPKDPAPKDPPDEREFPAPPEP